MCFFFLALFRMHKFDWLRILIFWLFVCVYYPKTLQIRWTFLKREGAKKPHLFPTIDSTFVGCSFFFRWLCFYRLDSWHPLFFCYLLFFPLLLLSIYTFNVWCSVRETRNENCIPKKGWLPIVVLGCGFVFMIWMCFEKWNMEWNLKRRYIEKHLSFDVKPYNRIYGT